jgi:hypothetical protein
MATAEENGKFKLKGKDAPGFDSEIEVDIGTEKAKTHKVVSKKIPDDTPYGKGKITWFNAYGVKLKNNDKDEYEDIPYTVTLNKLPDGKKLFLKLPAGIVEQGTEQAGTGKIKFTLAIGDPPTGFGP